MTNVIERVAVRRHFFHKLTALQLVMEYPYDGIRGALSPTYCNYACFAGGRYAEALAEVGGRGEPVA